MTALGGIISGIDTSSLINAMLQQQRLPINQWQQQREAADIKISRLGDFMSKLNTLKSTLEDNFGQIGDVLSQTATSGNEDVIKVSADGDASPGNYSIDVTTLAAYEKDRSDAFSSEGAEVKAGTLQIGTGPDATNAWVDITIEEGDSLATIANKINASDAKVNASVVSDGTSSYLQLSAQESGYDVAGTADQAIRINETYTGTTGQELNLVEVSTAQNAVATVDGLAVNSRSNSLTNVLPGVTIDLVASGSTTFDVVKDKAGTKENLQAFVDAFNEVAQLLDEELDVDGEQNRDRSLTGESVIRTLQSDFATMFSGSFIPDATNPDHDDITPLSTAFDQLAEIGITRDSDGKLSLDSEALDDALDGDMVAVAELFTKGTIGVVDQVAGLVDKFADGDTGLLQTRQEALEAGQDRLDLRIERLETRLEKNQAQLERQFMQMELAMAQMNQQTGALMSMMTGPTG